MANINIDSLAKAIYEGRVTPRKLSEQVYHVNAEKIVKGIYKGYGKQLKDIDYDTPDWKMLNSLRTNAYLFSAAKTFQQTLDMSDALVDENKIRPYNEFKDIVETLSDTYNELYLRTEYDTAIGSALNASAWERMVEEQDTLPYMTYQTIGDACDICAPLDGTTLLVTDSFWDTFYPPNHFNCRCLCLSGDADQMPTRQSVVADREKKVGAEMDDTFKMNVGKLGEVFSKDHPYFIVPDEYKDFAKTNFGLQIPEPEMKKK